MWTKKGEMSERENYLKKERERERGGEQGRRRMAVVIVFDVVLDKREGESLEILV